MKSGNYSLKELLVHNEIDQFIIPELQRDYVWGISQVNNLWNSILKRFNEKEQAGKRHSLKIYEGENEVEEPKTITDFLRSKLEYIKYKQKLGFLYAYHDKEWPGKFFLIDGQQRITTLFLLLTALYKRSNQMEDFAQIFFRNEAPIIDYKVRESAHEFLRLFLSDLIAGKDYRGNINYFVQDYKADQTVQNLQANYDFFIEKLSKEGVTNETTLRLIDYVENYIEFNYFDTNISEQGEKLYLYMNSRGFKLSHQEILRAKLIEKCSSQEKKKQAAERWEEMQNFFFENRGKHPDADAGFEIFLNIATLLKKQSTNHERGDARTFIYSLADTESNKPYQIENFDVSFLYGAFSALRKVLIGVGNPYLGKYQSDYFDIKVDYNDKDVSNQKVLYRYLPAIYYCHRFLGQADFSDDSLYRFIHFSVNQSHTRNVENEPARQIVRLMDFIRKMDCPILSIDGDLLQNTFKHENEKLDLINSKGIGSKFSSVLSDIYFDYNFQKLLEGDTELLFNLAKHCGKGANLEEILPKVVVVIKKMFYIDKGGEYNPLGTPDKGSNLLRRYLLTHFDFKGQPGSGHGGLPKYDVIYDNRHWLKVMQSDEFGAVVESWLTDGSESLRLSFLNRKNSVEKDDWRYPFIHYEEVLEHMSRNMFIWGEGWPTGDIILMRKTSKSREDIYLACKLFLIRSGKTKYRFNQHLTEVCYIDLVSDGEEIVLASPNDASLAIDLIYRTGGRWSMNVFYRDEGSDELRKRLSGLPHFTNAVVDGELSESRFTSSKFDFENSDADLTLQIEELYNHVVHIIEELRDLNLLNQVGMPVSQIVTDADPSLIIT